MSKIKTRPMPDFIGIGAQRTGTTWLYRNLSEHPEIWMPPIKEIHFFDRFDKTIQFKKRDKLLRDLRRRIAAYIFPRRGKNSRRNLRWDITYFFNYRDSVWYTSLFVFGVDKITGEITPAYMALDREIVEKIYAHNPNLKIIFILRDPIDRVWSAAIRHLAKQKQRDTRIVSHGEFQNFFQDRGTSLRTNYLRTLSIWESFFPSEQIHIDFYDNIQDDPHAVLLRIFKFLGVEENIAYISKKLHKKINSSGRYKMSIPPELEYEIAAMNLEQLEKLNQRFGEYTTKWLERGKKVLEINKNND